jgi:hypothetical protein
LDFSATEEVAAAVEDAVESLAAPFSLPSPPVVVFSFYVVVEKSWLGRHTITNFPALQTLVTG